jgi:putative transposase
MAHTYVSTLVHVVFSTAHREPIISEVWRQRLHQMMGGIARERGFPALAVGGTADHVHGLLSLPARLSLADVMRTLKSTSSTWINDTFFPQRTFRWQEGYGAFGVGLAARDATIAYILNQENHHRAFGFQDEFRDFLARHEITCDERHAWG